MPFDTSTAEPLVAEVGFDPQSAQPVSDTTDIVPKAPERHQTYVTGERVVGEPEKDLPLIRLPKGDEPLFEIPKLPEGASAAAPGLPGELGEAIGNVAVKTANALQTPKNVLIGAGLGEIAALAKGVGATAEAAKLAFATASAYFAAEGAKSTGESAAHALEVHNDPNSTPEQKIEAWLDVAPPAAMAALGAHGVRSAKNLGSDVAPETVAREEINAKLAAQKEPSTPFDAASAEPVESFDLEKAQAEASAEKVKAVDAALKDPETVLQYNVWDRAGIPEGRSRVLQVDLPSPNAPETAGTRNYASTSLEDLRARGLEVPEPPESLPAGRYTLKEIQDAIANEQAAKTQAEVSDFGSPESDTYGIANRVNEARAKSGDIAAVETGTSPGPEALVEQGRKMLKNGETPDEAFARAADIKDAGERLGFVRAYGEQLYKKASDAAEKFGTDSPEYAAAAKLDSDWAARIQPLKTELARGFHALQGETEIDTGTFHGMRRAFQELSGREFTKGEEATAKKFVADQKSAEQAVQQITPEFKAAIERVAGPAKKAVSSKVLSSLKERADAARERVAARLEKKFTLGAVEGPEGKGLLSAENLADLADIGAYHIARGVTDFAKWSEEMVKAAGEAVRPHLETIFGAAKKAYVEAEKGELGNTVAGVYQRAKDYLEQGETNPSDVVAKIAADLGTTQEDVWTKLASNKSVRRVTDETFKRMAARRSVTDAARNWVRERSTPLAIRIAQAPFNTGFRVATFGHGTVAPFTHAPTLGFNPSTFAIFWKNWAKGFRLMGLRDGGAFHERMMNDLVRDPNYITARRAGLSNEPHRAATDYEKAWMGGWLQKAGAVGNRGFDSLKLIRQEYFNQLWDKVPDSHKTPLMAQLIADSVNHATGTVRRSFGPVTRGIFFAPRLIASQFAHLVGDSAKAVEAVSKGAKASPEERAAAISHIKFLSTVVGAYISALTLNQGLLAASGSKQKINFTDPHQADWLKFKAIGSNIAPVSGPLAMVRFLANLLRIESGHLEGAEKRGGKGSALKDAAIDFARSKLSPTASVATDVVTGTDFQGRPLPFSKEKVPGYLKREGVGPYTYGEYVATHAAPIPVAEFFREELKKQGADETQTEHIIKALIMGAEAGAVGARVTPDYKVEGKK